MDDTKLMRFAVGHSPASTTSVKPNCRRHARYACANLTCTLGEVVDISDSGIRVRCKGKPDVETGQITTLHIECNNKACTLAAKIVWTHRIGFRVYEIGIEFSNLTPELRAALEGAARPSALDETSRRAEG